MKKIGILFGMETTFPPAVIERINQKKISGIVAEPVLIDQVQQGQAADYAVIIDRISQDVPFYRAYLKNAAISGTAVINNPFWWSADEKFFNNAVAVKLGVPVPKTVLLPSKMRPADTTENSFRNLKFPLSWHEIFNYIGFPAYMKPHSGGGWKSVYKINDEADFFEKYAETGELVMLFQEEIKFDHYFRCYCLGGKFVRIMQYEPRNPHHLRYVTNGGPMEQKLLDTIEKYVLALNHALGYDFNTVEFAVRDGIPYAIDFCNPAPDADVYSVGQENFEWVIEHAAQMAIERTLMHQDGKDNLTWGAFIQRAACAKSGLEPVATITTLKSNEATAIHSKSTTISNINTTTTSTTTSNIVSEKSSKIYEPTITMHKLTETSKGDVSTTTEKPTIVIHKSSATTSDAEENIIPTSKPDDLVIIEGIGPKIAELFNKNGIFTFAQLAAKSFGDLKTILEAAGARYRIHDPSTWAAQADLAAKGEWDKLKIWQAELKAGKKI